MTTMSAIFGALPLILSSATGSELRRPLGITIVGGLIMSQALTLVHHAGGLPVPGPLAPLVGRETSEQTGRRNAARRRAGLNRQGLS